MRQLIGGRCEDCEEVFHEEVSAGATLRCPNCSAREWTVPADDEIFKNCVICGCRRFFLQKDFNHILGTLIIIIAACLVPFTYGLSMLGAALIDFALYKKTNDMAVCYQCRMEYRGYPVPEAMEGYDHYTAEVIQVRKQKADAREADGAENKGESV